MPTGSDSNRCQVRMKEQIDERSWVAPANVYKTLGWFLADTRFLVLDSRNARYKNGKHC
jgi:hypothetical protein